MVKFGVFQVGFHYFSITERLEIHANHLKSHFFVIFTRSKSFKSKKKFDFSSYGKFIFRSKKRA